MRKRTLGAVLLAGLAVSGTGAFTASNTLPATTVAGYGAAAVTGATVTTIQYTPSATDSSKLSQVVFNSSTDVTGKTATMTLRSSGAQVGSPYTCTLGAYALTTMAITCSTGASDAARATFASFDSVALTVVQ
jgi:hypothetical protein